VESFEGFGELFQKFSKVLKKNKMGKLMGGILRPPH